MTEHKAKLTDGKGSSLEDWSRILEAHRSVSLGTGGQQFTNQNVSISDFLQLMVMQYTLTEPQPCGQGQGAEAIKTYVGGIS